MSTREIDGVTWVRKHPTDTVEIIKSLTNRVKAKLIDARFTFQPNGPILLSRNIPVAALTPEQLEMLVEWRVSDNQPIAIDSQVHTPEDWAFPMGPAPAVHKPIVESKYPHYFKDVRHLSYVDIYRLLDLFEITDQPIAHAIKKLMVAGARGAKDRDQDISEAIDCLLRRQAMRKEDTRENK